MTSQGVDEEGVGDCVDEEAPLLSGEDKTVHSSSQYQSRNHIVPENCCHPLSRSYKIMFCVLASLMCFGPQCAYDSIGAAGPFLRKVMGLHAEAIGELYSAYHLPNTFMVIIGGLLTDRIGTSSSCILCLLLICAGTSLVAFCNSFRLMLIGRLIFGLGSETLTIVQLSIITRWFSNSKSFPSLAVAMGSANAISSLGTVFVYYSVPMLGSAHVHHALFIFGLIPSVGSLLVGFLVIFLDEHAQNTLLKEERSSDLADAQHVDGKGSLQSQARHRRKSSIHKNEDVLSVAAIWAGISRFSSLFWMLIVYIVFYTGATQAWGNFATDMFVEEFHFSAVRAGRLTGAATFLATALIIPLGYVVDILGHRGTMLVVGALLLFVAHTLLQFRPTINPYVGVSFIGVAMSVIQASVYPSIARAVPQRLRGTAFGLTSAAMNISMVFFPFFTGYIHDLSNSYSIPMDMFLGYDVCCILISFVLMSTVVWRKILQSPYDEDGPSSI